MPEREINLIMESNNMEGNPPKKQATESNENGDRLSQLPDHILHVILSCLYTNDVMKTSLFGRRWRKIWTSMPYLRLADGFYLDGEANGKFKDFVNTLLLLRDAYDVHAFRLGWFNDFDPLTFDLWVRYLIEHNVKVLEIDAGECDELVDLPDSFFTCQSLEELSFTCAELSSLYAPEFTSLGQLTRLHLCNCLLRSPVETFIRGCPLLEDLNLQTCVIEAADISSDKLKSLTLRDCRICGSIMRISCPNLRLLHYVNNGTFTTKYVLVVIMKKLSYLLNASVVADSGERDINNDIDMIAELSAAEKLEFIVWDMKLIGEEQLHELPTFYNLKRLTLGRLHMRRNFETIAKFLRCSPYLQMLTLKGEEGILSWKCVHLNSGKDDKTGLSISCPNLKIIEIQIKGLEETKKVREAMKRLLPNGKISKIHCKSHGSKICNML